MPKKMFPVPDVAADSPSSESLSFAGLICVQDKKGSTKVQKEDLEFESNRSNASSKTGSPNKTFPADKLISNDHLATTIYTSPHQASKQIPLENFLQIPGNRRESDMKQTKHKCNSRKQISQVKRITNEKHTAGERSFGQKLFSSFATPCRDCRSSQPTPSIKQHTLQ
ncbi:hypothetical protein C2S51_012088 [Perilla frutescens var. frutescens]|nr:hypothetical protein C2S51_012088 [Perilla frutescens var. frutescens]